MTNYSPKWSDGPEWSLIADATRSVSRSTANITSYSEQQLAIAAAQYLRWRLATGECAGPAAFTRAGIETFIAQGLGHYSTNAGRNTLRSRLLRIAETLNGREGIVPLVPLGGSAASSPYTRADIEKLRGWARMQPTESRVIDATVLLALGLGAGLRGGEIINLRAADVARGSVVVQDQNGIAREVPVLADWQAELALAADRDGWVFRPGRQTANHNAVTDFVSRSTRRPANLAITTRRMRATWLQHHRRAGTAYLTGIAGIQHEDALLRYAS